MEKENWRGRSVNMEGNKPSTGKSSNSSSSSSAAAGFWEVASEAAGGAVLVEAGAFAGAEEADMMCECRVETSKFEVQRATAILVRYGCRRVSWNEWDDQILWSELVL